MPAKNALVAFLQRDNMIPHISGNINCLMQMVITLVTIQPARVDSADFSQTRFFDGSLFRYESNYISSWSFVSGKMVNSFDPE
ncbi:MAG: hypothetical protein ACPG7F_02330 [Aggregatilineales bacterium]